MERKKKINIIKILTIIATILAIVVSGITIYEKIKKDDDLVIEQRLSPEISLSNASLVRKRDHLTSSYYS